MQSNPYGSLYGGAQAHLQTPIQQQHVPWAASPADAPPQQPAALPGEPPLPGGNPMPNGRMQQVPSPFLFIKYTPAELCKANFIYAYGLPRAKSSCVTPAARMSLLVQWTHAAGPLLK